MKSLHPHSMDWEAEPRCTSAVMVTCASPLVPTATSPGGIRKHPLLAGASMPGGGTPGEGRKAYMVHPEMSSIPGSYPNTKEIRS